LESDADPLAVPDSVPSPGPVAAPMAAPAESGATADPGGAVLQKILAEAVGKRASGIQIERRGGDLSLFFRIDGILYRARVPALQTPGSLPAAVAARAGLPAEGAAAGRMTIRAGERRIEVVVRRLPAPGAESLLLKLLERPDFVRPLEAVGASRADLKRLLQATEQPHGLILLSGPPHNGVESTRYSLMAHLASLGRRVSSIESPLWLPIVGARQEEVPFPAEPERARAAAAGLAGTEVLFLPEIQTPAIAALAVEQAASCLVVAPLQARRASHAPAALLWYRVDPQAVAAVLRLVVSQRLVRRLCDGCRAATPAADHVLKMMGLTPDEAMDLTIYQGSGCERCGPLSPGSMGRVALYEVMEVTPEIGSILAAGGQPGEIEREARRAGMSPLRAACLALVGQGITSLEEFQKGNF
ncbi:MAG: GspE/PulE family protein, partial [Candidatus Polarisedimenticolia bacterium]